MMKTVLSNIVAIAFAAASLPSCTGAWRGRRLGLEGQRRLAHVKTRIIDGLGNIDKEGGRA